MKSPKTAFFEKIRRTETCWYWEGSKNPKGYGLIGPQYPTRRAHRYMYILTQGAIPEGFMVLHTCDNPSCVKPEHLKVGTAQDNTDDMIRKGRSNFNYNFGKQFGFKKGNPGYGYRRNKNARLV